MLFLKCVASIHFCQREVMDLRDNFLVDAASDELADGTDAIGGGMTIGVTMTNDATTVDAQQRNTPNLGGVGRLLDGSKGTLAQ